MTRLGTIIILIATATASAETLETFEKTVAAKFKEYQSLSADVAMTMDMGQGGTGNSTGTMEYLRHDGKELARTKLTMKFERGGHAIKSSVTKLYDGTNTYVISEMMGQKNVIRAKPSQMTSRPGGRAFFDDLNKDYTLKLLPDGKVDGKDVYVLEASPKHASERMTFYFDKAKGWIIKSVATDMSGKTVMTMTFSNIKVNPKLDPKQFEYTPEPGERVLDMTGK